MTTFPSITGSRLIRALRKLGFEVIRTKGSHHSFMHSPQRLSRIQFERKIPHLINNFPINSKITIRFEQFVFIVN